MMNWKQLLVKKRLGKDKPEREEEARTCFQRDFDRIVFSSAFRRLKDKTQVYSLSKNDYVRNRLTHSIEVSCIGRSLGTIIGYKIIEKYKDELKEYNASDFGSIVSAACLAHDIGNPPFGHAGEDAISSSFQRWSKSETLQLTEKEKADFEKFEGNAQGFRILTRLEMPEQKGGMQLTYPTLAAFTKYPRESFSKNSQPNNHQYINLKKNGFFQDDKELFEDIADTLGLIDCHEEFSAWSRHPLAFLVEAADDICYSIVDFEDGYRMGFISFEQTKELLKIIADKDDDQINKKANNEEEQIKYLRAVAIYQLVQEAAENFFQYESDILKGTFVKDLISLSDYNDTLKSIKKITRNQVFDSPKILSIEIAGYEILDHLLSKFLEAAFVDDEDYPRRIEQLFKILPEQCRPIKRDCPYQNILKITDYISGMTDSFALSLFQMIKGISLY